MSDKDQLQAKRKQKFKQDNPKMGDVLSPDQLANKVCTILGIQLRYNTIRRVIEFTHGLEWKQWREEQDNWFLEVRANADHADLQKEEIFKKAVGVAAFSNQVNPIKEYLDACPQDWTSWVLNNALLFDGIPATPGRLIAEYIDSDMDKKVIGEIFDCWLVGCAMHGYDPENNPWAGATICPILVGPQGCNKSRLTGWLGQAAGTDYYNESIIDVDNKDNRIALSMTWIWAADEFSGSLKKSKAEMVKNFISRRTITDRLAYGKRNEIFPRLASFIGTDNEMTPLQDTTGNRRFAVIQIRQVRLQELQSVVSVNRLWGGAMHLWKVLKVTPLIHSFAQETINNANDDALELHPWAEELIKRLQFDKSYKCTIQDVFQNILGIYPCDQTQSDSRKLHEILRSPMFKKYAIEYKNVKHDGKVVKMLVGCKI